MSPGNKQPRARLDFEPGPQIEPASSLRLWLELHPDTTVRMPVAVSWTFMGITSARVGQLDLELDDSAMGISLLDRVRQACDAPEGSCEVWLEGHPGPVMDFAPERVGDDDASVFAVRALVDPVVPGDDTSRILVVSSAAQAE